MRIPDLSILLCCDTEYLQLDLNVDETTLKYAHNMSIFQMFATENLLVNTTVGFPEGLPELQGSPQHNHSPLVV